MWGSGKRNINKNDYYKGDLVGKIKMVTDKFKLLSHRIICETLYQKLLHGGLYYKTKMNF